MRPADPETAAEVTRRAWFGLLAPAPLAAAPVDQLGQAAIAFNEPWGIFFRKLFGCSPNEREPLNCKPANREIDYVSFRKARDAAKKLFESA